MALTPCLVVGGKPLDVESNGFFFILEVTKFLVTSIIRSYSITSENERFRMS